jgi:polyhydroxyalkanoate synthesis regulator phasin
MIPYLLAAVGGYLIGDSMKNNQTFADGGETMGYSTEVGEVVETFSKNGKEVTGFPVYARLKGYAPITVGVYPTKEKAIAKAKELEKKNKMAGGMMAKGGITPAKAKKRLEELRKELRAERISWGELTELQSLKDYIDKDDVELLEAAGVPEFDDDEYAKGGSVNDKHMTIAKKSWEEYDESTGRTFTLVDAGYSEREAKKLSKKSWESLDKKVQEEFKDTLVSEEIKDMKGMMDSLYAYGGLEKDNKYLQEYKNNPLIGASYIMPFGKRGGIQATLYYNLNYKELYSPYSSPFIWRIGFFL